MELQCVSRSFVLILAAVAVPVTARGEKTYAEDLASASKIVNQTPRLTADDVNKLEEKLQTDPDDLDSRIRLVTYYSFAYPKPMDVEAKRLGHLYWLIEHRPEAAVHSFNFVTRVFSRSAAWDRCHAAWQKQVEAHPADARVLANAAGFYLIEDRPRCISLLNRACQLEPDNLIWTEQLGMAHQLNVVVANGPLTPEQRKQSSIAAEAALRKVYEQGGEAKAAQILQFLLSVTVETEDLERAERFAKEALRRAEERRANPGLAHFGNIVMGRIALRNGAIDEAKSRLLAAARSQESESVLTPDMVLANELLQKGESASVLEYFNLCEVFWRSGKASLQQWREEIQKGKKPDLRSSPRRLGFSRFRSTQPSP